MRDWGRLSEASGCENPKAVGALLCTRIQSLHDQKFEGEEAGGRLCGEELAGTGGCRVDGVGECCKWEERSPLGTHDKNGAGAGAGEVRTCGEGVCVCEGECVCHVCVKGHESE